MLAELLRVVRDVPGWTWWILLNLLAFAWYVLAQVRELRHQRTGVMLTVRAMYLVCVALLGVIWVLGVTALDAVTDELLPRSDASGPDETFEDRDRTRRGA